MQDTGAVVKYVDLTARRAEPVEFKTAVVDVKGCQPGFDGSTPRPPEYCYPFPVTLKVMAFNPKAGYTTGPLVMGSLVVRVTNTGKGPVALPVGAGTTLPRGEAGELSFSVHIGDDVRFVGFGSAFGDTAMPESLATLQPGESVEYEIPMAIDRFTARLPRYQGPTVPLVVHLDYSKIKKQDGGKFSFVHDTNFIPSDEYRTPFPE